MNGRARPGARGRAATSTTLPPSSGSTGSRLNAPITGPAHHTAAAASVLPRLKASNGSMPMTYSTSNELVMWVTGPASAMAASVPLESGFGVVYDA